jgi:hypothetical protein
VLLLLLLHLLAELSDASKAGKFWSTAVRLHHGFWQPQQQHSGCRSLTMHLQSEKQLQHSVEEHTPQCRSTATAFTQ